MTIVDGEVSYNVFKRIEEEIANEPTEEEDEKKKLDEEKGLLVQSDLMFTTPRGRERRGYYMNKFLKDNLDNYLIKAVIKHWDGVLLVTGIEGSSKSTNAFAVAKYIDPTFPGEPLNDGTTRRTCERIVFTQQQFMEQVDKAPPRTAIVWDEMVMGGLAQDASSEAQKILIKKMVTIRKKQLFLIFVIPSIFLLRLYFAVFRTRALLHFYSPDGISRGQFKFYSYNTKRKLFILGRKEFNQDCVRPDFIGDCTNTMGFFFDLKEYDKKKEDAIQQLTSGEGSGNDKVSSVSVHRNLLLYDGFKTHLKINPTLSLNGYSRYLTETYGTIGAIDPGNISRYLKKIYKLCKLQPIVNIQYKRAELEKVMEQEESEDKVKQTI